MGDAAGYEEFKRQRLEYLTGPVGNMALIDYQAVGEQAAPITGWPAYARRNPGDAGVWVSAEAAAGVRVDGELVDGETFVQRLRADGHPLVTWGAQTIDVFSLDGSDYELRRYDAAAPALANFDGVEYYDYDPDLCLTGTLRPYDETDVVPWDFTRVTDSGHTKQVPGLLEVTIGGKTFELLAFADSGVLVLTFSDATTGAESYPPGRFLKVDPPGADGVIELDFNRTIIPPCGFSDFYSCPLPPPQNRMDVVVRGGEKTVRWKQPRY